MPTEAQWRERWVSGNTSWDIQGVTPALVEWAKTHAFKNQAILVTGCGRGYDAHFMNKRGATVTAVDISPEALTAARAQHPQSTVKWEVADAITMSRPTTYDRIWEYTCFCALEPQNRAAYLKNIAAMLRAGGVFWGLVNHHGGDPQSGPPYSIHPDDFRAALTDHFDVLDLTFPAPVSIKARRGIEIWFEARRLES